MAKTRGKQALALALLLLDSEWNEGRRKERKSARKKKRMWTRSWRGKKGQFGIAVLQSEHEADDQSQFRDLLRMDVREFNHLLQLVTPLIAKQNTQMRPTISARERLSVTLRFLATGESFASLSSQYHMGRSTISGIVRKTCEALYLVLKDDYLKTPTTEEQWRQIARDFQERWQFPHCVGALDGKLITIRPPASVRSSLSNDKPEFSVVLLAAVNASHQFLYAQICAEDRAPDGSIYARSDLRRAMEQKRLNLPPAQSLPGTDSTMPFMFVANEAFALEENLMKPYPLLDLDHDQRVFNYRLSRARCVAENAFGILTTRWQIFLSPISLDPGLVSQMTLATLSLHNFLCEHAKDEYKTPSIVDTEDEAHTLIPGSWRNGKQLPSLSAGGDSTTTAAAAEHQRETLKSYFVSPAGSVAWQQNNI